MIARRAVASSTANVSTPALRRAEAAQGARWPSISDAWRETLGAFAHHSLSILVFAVIGFAGAGLLGLSLSQAASHDDARAAYLHASGPLASHEGLRRLSFATHNGLFTFLLTQSAIGLILTAFAHGAITHLALFGSGWHVAGRMALRRLPRLVASTLLYSTVIGFGAISVNAWLRDADYDLSDVGQKAVTIEGVQRLVFLRGLNTFVPDPGSPMSEFVPYLRHKALRHLEPVEDYDQKLINEYGRVMGAAPVIASPPPDHSGEVRILMVAGLLAFVIGEVLLRFRAVMAMQTTGLVTPLLRSLGWGIRHCGVIAVHALVVRLALWAFGVALVVAPVVIAQCFGADVLAKVGLPRDLVSVPTMIASVALVNSVCTAFGAVYDARLYLRLVEHPC